MSRFDPPGSVAGVRVSRFLRGELPMPKPPKKATASAAKKPPGSKSSGSARSPDTSRRDMYAGLAMLGLVIDGEENPDDAARRAMAFANALNNALNGG